MTEIKPFLPADAAIILGDRNCTEDANYNHATGPGFTLLKDNRPIASAGIRIYGVGELWAILSDEAKDKNILSFMKKFRKQLEDTKRAEKIAKLYAESTVSDIFIEHFGLTKRDNIFVG